MVWHLKTPAFSKRMPDDTTENKWPRSSSASRCHQQKSHTSQVAYLWSSLSICLIVKRSRYMKILSFSFFSWALRQQAHLHLFDKPWIRVSEFYIIPHCRSSSRLQICLTYQNNLLERLRVELLLQVGVVPCPGAARRKTLQTGQEWQPERWPVGPLASNPEPLQNFDFSFRILCLHACMASSVFLHHTPATWKHTWFMLRWSSTWPMSSGLRACATDLGDPEGHQRYLHFKALCHWDPQHSAVDKAWTADQLTSVNQHKRRCS